MSNPFKVWLTGLNPWLPIFLFVTLFQIIRGSVGDAVIFGAVSLLLFLDWKRIIRLPMPERPRISPTAVWLGALGIGLALYFAPKDGPIETTLLLALAPAAVGLVWYRDHGPKPAATKPMLRSKYLWISLAITLACWELFAFILSDIVKNNGAFPTVSVLVSPFLNLDSGRAVFLVLWLAIGVGLLRVKAKKSGTGGKNLPKGRRGTP